MNLMGASGLGSAIAGPVGGLFGALTQLFGDGGTVGTPQGQQTQPQGQTKPKKSKLIPIIVGERGEPELVLAPEGSQVIPMHKIPRAWTGFGMPPELQSPWDQIEPQASVTQPQPLPTELSVMSPQTQQPGFGDRFSNFLQSPDGARAMGFFSGLGARMAGTPQSAELDKQNQDLLQAQIARQSTQKQLDTLLGGRGSSAIATPADKSLGSLMSKYGEENPFQNGGSMSAATTPNVTNSTGAEIPTGLTSANQQQWLSNYLTMQQLAHERTKDAATFDLAKTNKEAALQMAQDRLRLQQETAEQMNTIRKSELELNKEKATATIDLAKARLEVAKAQADGATDKVELATKRLQETERHNKAMEDKDKELKTERIRLNNTMARQEVLPSIYARLLKEAQANPKSPAAEIMQQFKDPMSFMRVDETALRSQATKQELEAIRVAEMRRGTPPELATNPEPLVMQAPPTTAPAQQGVPVVPDETPGVQVPTYTPTPVPLAPKGKKFRDPKSGKEVIGYLQEDGVTYKEENGTVIPIDPRFVKGGR